MRILHAALVIFGRVVSLEHAMPHMHGRNTAGMHPDSCSFFAEQLLRVCTVLVA